MRVALFGCGWIQDFHARAVREHGDELVAVANHREETARVFAERHGIAAGDHGLGGAGRRPGGGRRGRVPPRTPCMRRRSVALLDAGMHVLVEKPMATDLAGCDAMIRASAASGAFLMVAHCWRFRDEVIALRDRIAAGELGEVVKTRGYGVHANWGPAGWFVQRQLAGGGALADMGVHAIDTVRFLLGIRCRRASVRRSGRGTVPTTWTTTRSC